MFYRIAYFLITLYSRLVCRRKITGREHVPERGPFIVIVNHLSTVDPPLVLSVLPAHLGMTGMAAMAHRNDFFIGWLMDRCGAIWVRRGQSDRRALRQALETLESGRPIGLSPEGTRSDTGALIEGKSGAAYLALKANVPILPMTVAGSEDVYASLKRLRRANVEIKIGPMFWLPPRGDGKRSAHLQYCTDLMMGRLASMLPESYHGVYADHPLVAYWEALDASGQADRPAWKRKPRSL